MIKKLTSLFLITCAYFLIALPVSAKDFSSYNKTVYEFNDAGQAFVTQEISLVNETSNMYISEYSLSLSGGEIDNVEAFDSVGPLQTKTGKSGDKTSISLSFNDKIAGKGKILSFILKYKIKNLAKKSGSLWEVSIPKLGDSAELDEYKLILKIPVSFGNASSINPRPVSEEKTAKFSEMTFAKEALSDFGISATFGQLQTYDFKISYVLKNDSSDTVQEKITLPSDTNYQSVYYEKIIPEPDNVETDEDGNWMAVYLIPPKSRFKIETSGKATVFSRSRSFFPADNGEMSSYLEERKYWEISDPEIKSLAEKLKTPRKIFDFVVKTLSYDYEQKDKVVRKGALFALKNPKKSLCSEFTDLFIALCRSAGIPSREVVGIAFSDNPKTESYSASSDVLHAWPEYFDKEKNEWIMVDPTFSNTSGGLDYFNQFDMDHFSLVVHGKESGFPFPAGSFRDESSEKQIFVSVGKSSIVKNPSDLIIINVYPKTIWTLRKNEVFLKIKNISGEALYHQNFIIKGIGGITPDEFLVADIPPYGGYTASFFIKPKEVFSDYVSDIVILSEKNSLKFELKTISSTFRLVIAGCLSISLLIVSVLISIRKNSRKNNKFSNNVKL